LIIGHNLECCKIFIKVIIGIFAVSAALHLMSCCINLVLALSIVTSKAVSGKVVY